MKLGGIEIVPLAAESMGVRSLCTFVQTPDVSILLDPSAALAYRPPHDPHPEEYRALERALERIHHYSKEADILSISHYHFDHIRPGVTNWHYNFSTLEDRLSIMGKKRILAKDNRENINPSQRRRAFYFERDLNGISSIEWVDGKRFDFNDTSITYSHALPHGPENSKLGFVVATTIEYEDNKVLFAPDVQGPISRKTLGILLHEEANCAIIGGPPIYLKRFSDQESQAAIYSLTALASTTEILIIDHHLMRSLDWGNWISPIKTAAERAGHSVISMADAAGRPSTFLEAERNDLYLENPPSVEFQNWLASSDQFKIENKPPL